MSTVVPLLDKNVDAAKRRGVGCLEVMSKATRIKLPLSAVQLRARVAGCLAHVTVTETFQNPYSDHLEAVYIFPLSGGCAVSSFQMKVGERLIEGMVSERQAARKDYAEAMQQGKRAALLEQDRDDVFTVQIGNLPPGEEITVILTYSEKLPYFDQGVTEIRLPLVVAPRYIPGVPLERQSVGDGVELDTDIVPDASRITPPRLASGVDAKIDLNISVELDSSETIEDLSCSQHATRMGANKDGVVISLAREDDLLDRDFVLRWRVASDRLQSSFLIYRSEKDGGNGSADANGGTVAKGGANANGGANAKGGAAGKNVAQATAPAGQKGSAAKADNKIQYYGMVSLVPPKADEIVRPSRDVIFVLDRSGSMQGIKMASAARACSFLLATLGPSDRFAIAAFDDYTEWLTDSAGGHFYDADEAGMDAGTKFLRTIEARGGTELHHALDHAIAVMDKRPSKSARMPVIVILTDGEVGNESAIFKHIQGKLGDSRVFTVGIDTAVNDGFLRRLASLGGGTATFVEPGAQLEAALSHVGREIGTPLIMDLSIEDINCGLDKDSIAPSHLADLFEGRTVSAFFRLSPAHVKDLSTLKIRLKGKYADGKNFVTDVGAKTTDVQALPQLWAKSLVVDLEDQYRMADRKKALEIESKIVAVAVEHSLLTKFTAFVVVDHSEVVNQDGTLRKVVQPVQMPAKWHDEPVFVGVPFGAAAAMSAGGWGAASPRIGSIGHMSPPASNFSYGAPAARFSQSNDQSKTDSWGASSSSSLEAYSDGASSSSAPWGAPSAPAQGAGPQQSMPQTPASNQASPSSNQPTTPSNQPTTPSNQPTPPSNQPTPSQARQKRIGGPLPPGPAFDQAVDKLFGQSLGVNSQVNMGTGPQRLSSDGKVLQEEWSELQKCYQHFEETLAEALKSLGQGKVDNSDQLDQARVKLLKALSLLSVASKLPLLQKYLRADLLHLIAALTSAKTISEKLKDLGREHEQKLERISEEVSQLQAEETKSFWSSTI